MSESKIILRYAQAIDNLQILNENLMNCLKECSDDLESEINDRYGNTHNLYPSQKRRYDNDMKPVIDARLWLERSKKENEILGDND